MPLAPPSTTAIFLLIYHDFPFRLGHADSRCQQLFVRRECASLRLNLLIADVDERRSTGQ